MNKKRFVYLMQFNEKRTLQYLSGLKLRIVERKFFRATRERGKHRYWGWVAFTEPIELFDAMEAGLFLRSQQGYYIRVRNACQSDFGKTRQGPVRGMMYAVQAGKPAREGGQHGLCKGTAAGTRQQADHSQLRGGDHRKGRQDPVPEKERQQPVGADRRDPGAGRDV